ncbi:MAG TPA: SAF domain-containing protein [Microlunatus sp.]|jgi:hypothetical protein
MASTTSTERPAGNSKLRRRAKAPRVVESRVPTPTASPTKNRRRPAFAALAVALLALCALAGWATFQSVSATVPVVGVRETVTKGTIVQRDDLTIMQVGNDSNLHVIPATDIDQVIGRRAATDLPAGGIVPSESITDALVPAKGRSVIGIFARDGSAPLVGIEPGTRVRLVPLPATQEQPNPPKGQPQPTNQLVPGVVIASTPTDDGTGVRIDVDVAVGAATGVQILAAQNRIALVIDSQER